MTNSQGQTPIQSGTSTYEFGQPAAPAKASRGVGVIVGIAVGALLIGGGAGYAIAKATTTTTDNSSCAQAVQAADVLVIRYETMLRLVLAGNTDSQAIADATRFREDITAQLDVLNTAGPACTG